jgi:hypothetical protein
MTVVRRGFRAKEACIIEGFWRETILNLTFRHQSQKTLFVCAPVALIPPSGRKGSLHECGARNLLDGTFLKQLKKIMLRRTSAPGNYRFAI